MSPRIPFMRPSVGALLLVLGSIGAAQTTQNTTTSYQYDANSNLTQITDPLGRVTRQSYDALNRLKHQLRPAPMAGAARSAINYSYDGLDQLLSVTDPRYLVTSYTIDGLGNLTAVSSPDTLDTSNTYDAAGNLLTSTDARAITTSYSYDALNRLTRISYPDWAAIMFEYDGGANGAPNAKGRLTKITDESGSTSYSYDAHGRILSKTQAVIAGPYNNTFTVRYSYLAGGKLANLTYPSGNRLNLSYDAAGRIASLTLNPTAASGSGTDTGATINLLTGIGHVPFGAANRWTWGNSTATSVNTYARGIDLDGRITAYPLGNELTNGTQRRLAYDAASRITATTHTGSGTGAAAAANFNQNYSYDDLDRLTGFTGSNTSQSYQYDANGNRTRLTIGGNSYDNSIDPDSNLLASTTGPLPAKSNDYDDAGNLVGDGSIIYTYSPRGQLYSAEVGTATISYLYNGLGQRVQKSGPSTNFVYDEQGRLIGEYDSYGKLKYEMVYLGDLPVALLKQSVSGVAPNRVTTTQVYYIYADHIDTPRVITRASDNKIVWRWDNADPFGMTPPNQNPSGLGTFTYNVRMPGQYYDTETNTHYNWHRTYDPQTGRYLQSDPIGLKGGPNTYAYVDGNPISFIDSDGLEKINLIDRNKDPMIWRAGENYPDIPGTMTVISHGSPKTVNRMNEQDLAKYLQGHGWKPGMPVKLNACQTGVGGDDSIGQKLANELGTTVIAPNRNVVNFLTWDLGPIGGKWITFNPK